MNLYRSLLLSVIVLGAIACGNEKKKDEKEIGKSESQSPLITVDTLVLKKRTFQKQNLSAFHTVPLPTSDSLPYSPD